MNLSGHLEGVIKRFEGIEAQLADPDVISDPKKLRDLSRERSQLEETVIVSREYQSLEKQRNDLQEILRNEKDEEILSMAREELPSLEERLIEAEKRLRILLLPPDPRDAKNVIVEIRAGTGGDEAALFTADLFRMYQRYAEQKGWSSELLSSSPTGIGGYKEVIFTLEGEKVYSRMKYEGGTHRVQRVPDTEASGRIHTSASTVAVLPEADEVEVQIDPKEIRIDVFRSSGPGGQSVNTTDSAVRITHVPTGIVISCQDEKSQHKNKAKALKILRARLQEAEEQKQANERRADRMTMVGSGDRSEKIRTYNFPQGRVTDHRIGLTVYQLQGVLNGEMDLVIDPLIVEDQAERLKRVE